MIRIPHQLFEVFVYAGFVLSITILGITIYFSLNPYMSKIFFSYSHKDIELAKKIMDHLQTHHFKIWIDFELEIPESRIETVLKGNILRRDVFILLGSVNSAESKWVQFELTEAFKKSTLSYSKWKDILVVALDDSGIQLFQTIFESVSEKHLQAQAFLDNVNAEAESKYAEWDEDINRNTFLGIPKNPSAEKLFLKVFGRDFAKRPGFTRLFFPTVTLIDLRESFESSMSQLARSLGISAARYVQGSKPYKKVWLIPIGFWTVTALFYGLFIMRDLLSH